MATARDVVQRALRIISVVAIDEPATAEMSDNTLQALNAMLKGWKAHGVDVNHDTDYRLSSTFETTTLTDQYEDAVTFCLAKKIAPEFSVSLTAEAARDAMDGWSIIQANFLTSEDLTFDKSLRRMPSRRYGVGYW
jgi:hypothetical protein